ncbi:MAG: DNA polymerase III subunit gamma/tau [Candidatus Accumulibacter sp.]|jgi:DNA polymerase-3 subunit gamma/tau|nr:DNA polymerase III subunit gamma/tau [Accumulibacter sp.]
MSYQVLARKWRPRTFETLVGQEHVVRALTHALTDGRLHHAYLFTGTRGVGKTTLARILAKSFNCETGVTATPCGTCSACAEIDAGRFVDLLEVDAATNTKVDEMRQLLENAVYAPTRGRFKVYVIDEVHMLSNSAFNAMLKTLEEPPEHVKFILATTDPQKIPVTVLSRCLQFNLKQMTPPLIAAHLKHILEAEAIRAEPAALNLIARSAAGSMRDALSLLDQAIAHGAGKVEEALVRDMLGTVDLDYLFDILDALLAGDVAGMLRVAGDMAARSLSFSLALQEFASLMTRLQVAQFAPRAVAEDLPERQRLLDLANRLDPEYVQLAYQIAVQGRNELHLAPDEQDGFTMTLLRLHAFRPATAGDAMPAAQAAPARPASFAADRKTAARESVPLHAPAKPVAGPVPEFQPISQSIPPPIPPPDAAPPQPLAAAAPPVDEENVDWHALLATLELSGMARELGQHCELRSMTGGRIVLCLPPAHRHLQIKTSQDKIQQALSARFGKPVRLSIELDEVSGETPADTARRQRQERQEQAVAAVERDAFVREAIDLLGATLIESSIKPV